MFAGIDSESVFSLEPNPRLQRSKSAAHPSRSHSNSNSHSNSHSHHPNPFADPSQSASRISVREEQFGWSGSVGGIRGRDDRQIERDMEYERKMDERTRMRHERKLARAQQARGLAPTGSASRPAASAGPSGAPSQTDPPPYDGPARRRPLFAPTEADEAVAAAAAQPSSPGMSLSRAKSLRDKVEAALGRWNSMGRAKSIGRSKSVSAIDVSQPPSPPAPAPAPPPVERKEGFGALARRLSRKITIEDRQRRRREREQMLYAEPPLLSHDLVGAASPFPMRPALSTLVPTEQLKYGEAHTDYSPNPYRRRRNLSEVQRPSASSHHHHHHHHHHHRLNQHPPAPTTTTTSNSSPFSK